VAYSSVKDEEVPSEFRTSSLDNVVRGAFTALFVFKRLPHYRTEITYVASINLKGSVPSSVTTNSCLAKVNRIVDCYNHYKKEEEIDGLMRDDFVQSMETCPDPTATERKLVMRALTHASLITMGGRVERRETTKGMDASKRKFGKWQRRWSGGVATSKMNNSIKKYAKYKEGESTVWGKGVAIVHAKAEQVLAWIWLTNSICRIRHHQAKHGNMERMVKFSPNGHSRSQVSKIHHQMRKGLSTREYLNLSVWQRMTQESIHGNFNEVVCTFAYEAFDSKVSD
tara:strand:- start:692 stop:1540 length:849 start_codon:yes stop_codon:yes gene_type:complete